jgi:thymidine kinase
VTLEVVCGPMFSGKTQTLIRRLAVAKSSNSDVVAVKPKTDSRFPADMIVAHAGDVWPAITVASSDKIKAHVSGADVIGIDEAQFFDEGLVRVATELANNGARVIVAGLDLDFRGWPFGPMPQLLTLASDVAQLAASCAKCGASASFTQRLVGGSPAPATGDTVLIGANELYEPRCINCFVGYDSPLRSP